MPGPSHIHGPYHDGIRFAIDVARKHAADCLATAQAKGNKPDLMKRYLSRANEAEMIATKLEAEASKPRLLENYGEGDEDD